MQLALLSAPSGQNAVTAQILEVGVDAAPAPLHKPERSGEWLEYRPLITMVVVRARRRMAGAGIHVESRDHRDLEFQYLQPLVPDAGRAAALAAAQFPRCGRQGGAGESSLASGNVSRCRPRTFASQPNSMVSALTAVRSQSISTGLISRRQFSEIRLVCRRHGGAPSMEVFIRVFGANHFRPLA
jgi:hypothetical protein